MLLHNDPTFIIVTTAPYSNVGSRVKIGKPAPLKPIELDHDDYDGGSGSRLLWLS